MTRFYEIKDLMWSAYRQGQNAQASALANEYLDLAARNQGDWNYGNAIHDANTMLGLLDLKNGDPDAAEARLLRAGTSPGSPQLNSFGPRMHLAMALLDQGRLEGVKTYLKGVQKFWDLGRDGVEAWLQALEQGQRPTLSNSDAIAAGTSRTR
jgi:hypothetical protein